MASKYQCPKCAKKFIDWGAEKAGFACPECSEDLVEIGFDPGSDAAKKKKKSPSLKRGAKKKAAAKKKAPAKKKAAAKKTAKDAEPDSGDDKE